MHKREVTKHCHYYNNDKICPFEELGCMFLHKTSETCKYDQECSKVLCAFKHPEANPRRTKGDELTAEIIEVTDDESVECDYCKKRFGDIDDLIDHFGKTEHNLLEDQHAPAWP